MKTICFIGDSFCPPYNGTGLSERDFKRSEALCLRELFFNTVAVIFLSSFSEGIPIMDTVPFIRFPIYVPSPPSLKFFPPLGPLPKPLALVTIIFLPSGVILSLEGNQPAGICPSTLKEGRAIIPIAFIPASATNRCFSSGETARPKGITPLKCFRLSSGFRYISLTTESVLVSITVMLSLLPLLVKTQSEAATSELGLDPPTAGIPSTICPTRFPVFILAVTFGLLISSIEIAQTEKALSLFGSPRPGITRESVTIPFFIASVL